MDREPLDSGRIYTVAQRISALTTGPTEVMSLIASSMSKVELLRLELAQTSTLPVVGMIAELFRHTSASTGGSTAGGALVPVNIRGHAAAPASTSVVVAASTVAHSTAAAARFFADTFAMDSGKFAWSPPFPETVDVNQRFHARITSLTTLGLGGLTASLTFRETGRVPG